MPTVRAEVDPGQGLQTVSCLSREGLGVCVRFLVRVAKLGAAKLGHS